MMTVPEGIDTAKHHLSAVLPELSEAQLEELETPPSGSRWRFIFSAMLPAPEDPSSLAQLLRSRRITKAVEIDPDSGALLAVRNAAA